ncbi:hypothetical protein WR25_24052 [Diploscapter pachys]|uniref:Uncharacterized protein n=1 Tax=Diploscapter pachys TaxID=2018661 RepID=A0A2A2LBH6_9BILA|nr:hypothetical protein WR25_24052 [Diploscapter pachys]
MVRMVRGFWRGTLTQPFAIKLFKGIWNSHPRFATRTIMVKDNDVDAAFATLNRRRNIFCANEDYLRGMQEQTSTSLIICSLMESEGLLKIIRSTQFYQKPYMQRNLLSIEASRAIFNEDMSRKMKFLVRKNRPNAHPGQLTT